MLSLYLLLLTFKVVATVTASIYCVKIARMKITQTYTWMLFSVAFMLRFMTQIQTLVFTKNILGYYADYSIWLILANQLIECIIVAAFLVGIMRSYYSIKDAYFLV